MHIIMVSHACTCLLHSSLCSAECEDPLSSGRQKTDCNSIVLLHITGPDTGPDSKSKMVEDTPSLYNNSEKHNTGPDSR